MGELERYGLLSAALLLLMAGLLAFFGRDAADGGQGARALSANPTTLDHNAGPRTTHDPGAVAPKVNEAAPPVDPKSLTPAETERKTGDDSEIRPRPPGGETAANNPKTDDSKAHETPKADPVKAAEPDAPVHYKVKAGDTLSSIAKAHFGDKKYYPLIQAANPDANSNSLKVDQELILPAKSAIADFGKKAVTPPETKTDKPSDSKTKAPVQPKSTKSGSGPGVEPVPTGSKPKGAAKENALAVADKPTAADSKTASKDKKDADKSVVKKTVREHTVAKGDTLASIARHYYDDANKWKVIFEANRDKLKSTSIVPVGVVLKIP